MFVVLDPPSPVIVVEPADAFVMTVLPKFKVAVVLPIVIVLGIVALLGSASPVTVSALIIPIMLNPQKSDNPHY